jgi:hypothetical protein
VHHIDGNHSNDEPANLVLIEGTDHLRLHGMQLPAGISAWRKKPKISPTIDAERFQRGREIYGIRCQRRCTWTEVAKIFFGSDKPAGKYWIELGMSVFADAQYFAKRSGSRWPISRSKGQSNSKSPGPVELNLQ